MILTQDIDQLYARPILKKLCCPICLSALFHVSADKRKNHLSCQDCGNTFLVYDGLPILLIDDENWRKKRDEIEGEVHYNVAKVSPDVHEERNAFVNENTESFLQEVKVDLSRDDILIVGSSIAELEFFYKKSRNVTALDIVPSLAKMCFEATKERGISAAWICGDGEYLPFEDESFDTVVVRQTLHHMVNYHAAICDFFRVCKRGGRVLIIDEPFAPPDLEALGQIYLSDDLPVYERIKLGDIRRVLNISSCDSGNKTVQNGLKFQDRQTPYIEPEAEKPETFLADKYHTFSLVACLLAVLQHSKDVQIAWPKHIAWTVDDENAVRFCQGKNPNYDRDTLDKLVSPGNASISVEKASRTTIFSDRSKKRALPLEVVCSLVDI